MDELQNVRLRPRVTAPTFFTHLNVRASKNLEGIPLYRYDTTIVYEQKAHNM